MRYRTLIPLLVAVLLLAVLISLLSGSVRIGLVDLLRGEGNAQVVMELRLPRTLTAALVGALLALAGALMQVLLRNPLADPYILGVSGGAAVGALLSLLAQLPRFFVSLFSVVGALASTLLVFGLAHGRGAWSSTRLLLTGVVLAAGWGAVVSLLLAISRETNVKGMLFWLMGDIGYQLPAAWTVVVLVAGLAIAMLMARELNLLGYGDSQALSLGVNVGRVRLVIYFLAAVLTAAAVSLAGSVGFVGLVVPHFVRLVTGGDHRGLLPAAALCGAILLVLADTVARTVIDPESLPVGVITAFIGVPLFLFLLSRSTRSRPA